MKRVLTGLATAALIFLLVLGAATAVKAEEPSGNRGVVIPFMVPCNRTDVIFSGLMNMYAEERRFVIREKGHVNYSFWSNAETGAWTWILTYEDLGLSCISAVGKNWFPPT